MTQFCCTRFFFFFFYSQFVCVDIRFSIFFSYSPDAHFISTNNNNNTENRIIKIFKFIHVCLKKEKKYFYTYSGKKISRKNWQIITTYDDANEVEAIVYVPFAIMYDFYNFYFIAIRQTPNTICIQALYLLELSQYIIIPTTLQIYVF